MTTTTMCGKTDTSQGDYFLIQVIENKITRFDCETQIPAIPRSNEVNNLAKTLSPIFWAHSITGACDVSLTVKVWLLYHQSTLIITQWCNPLYKLILRIFDCCMIILQLFVTIVH